MGVTVFLSDACEVCQALMKRYPDLEHVKVEDSVDLVQKTGIRAVPAILYEDTQRVKYGSDYIHSVANPLEDEIPF